MGNIDYYKEHFDQLQLEDKDNGLGAVQKKAFLNFSKMGIPTARHEEWKYTRIAGLFNREYSFPGNEVAELSAAEVDGVRLPGYEQANELVFVNGIFSSSLSTLRSPGLVVMPLEESSRSAYSEIVAKHLGHSANYMKDGLNALNTAFMHGGVFVHLKKGYTAEHPVYLYNITDARSVSMLSQPRSFVHIDENAQVQLVETYITLGSSESLTNQVMEIIVEKGAMLEYYKIQNDAAHANQVSTTHIRQVGKSYTHTVTVSLNGGIVRNNLNVVLEGANSESHLYGLNFQGGHCHIDNHTVVDNFATGCLSNELYKGILDDHATGVFNGKIFIQPHAQKTNAYQTNKNILLSETASINAKPQLEIFADDVKCSHGCTVGRLDEESLFYLRARGIPENIARSLLLHGFALDILEKIRLAPIRGYVDQLISERLEFDIS